MTVTGTARESSVKICVIPSLVPRMPLASAILAPDPLQLDLDVDAGRQVQPLQFLNRFGRGIHDVDEPLVGQHLEMLTAVLVLVGSADHRVDRPLGGKRHGPHDARAGTGHVIRDLAGLEVQHLVVVGAQLDANARRRHQASPPARISQLTVCSLAPYLRILTTRPAPTVRPPSRIANRRPSSMAIGCIRSMCMSVRSPGMTISVPSGRLTTPDTSVVRK